MFLVRYIVNPLVALISLFTTTGVVLHDTQVDKAMVSAISLSAASADSGDRPAFQKSDPHTHSERVSLSQAIRDLRTANPRIQPRRDENHYTNNDTRRNNFGPDTLSSLFDPGYLS